LLKNLKPFPHRGVSPVEHEGSITLADERVPTIDEGARMLARYIQGEDHAFDELVHRFGGAVYGYLRRSGLEAAAADDLFQEAFTRVHLHAKRFDPGFSFKTWLLTITQNLVRSHWRRQRVQRMFTGWWRRGRRPEDPRAGSEDPPDPAAGAEQTLARQEEIRLLEQALGGLPEGQRQAIVLTQVEGLSQEQAAAVLHVPVPTVKTWVRRARGTLGQALAGAREGAQPS
jgi:RNA polymerase sigma factor (sigma-70 family)